MKKARSAIVKRSRIRCPLASAQRGVGSSTPSSRRRSGAAGAPERIDQALRRREQALELGVELRPPIRQASRAARAGAVPALELARVVAPALLAHPPGRVERRECTQHPRAHLRRARGTATRASAPSRATARAHAPTASRRAPTAPRPSRRAARGGSPGRSAISSRWLTVCSIPEAGRRAPRHAHRDPAQGERRGEVVDRVRIAAGRCPRAHRRTAST